MRFRDLDELVALGQLERKPPDPPRVRRWLDRSHALPEHETCRGVAQRWRTCLGVPGAYAVYGRRS